MSHLQIAQHCRVVDVQSIDTGAVRSLCDQLADRDLKLVLLAVPSAIAVHTFCAMLLDYTPFSLVSRSNVGYGTHLSPEVAATRAITEAAQVRVTRIHGAREDLPAQGSDHYPQLL